MFHYKIVSGCSVIFFVLFQHLMKHELIDSISYSISIIALLFYTFELFAWRILRYIPFLRDFCPPYVQGIWTGNIKSSYTPYEIKSTFTIKQSFRSCKIYIETNDITSENICAYWSKEGTVYYLIYTYRTNPKKTGNYMNPPQYGTAKIRLENNRLIGDYWTSQKTTGDIDLTKY